MYYQDVFITLNRRLVRYVVTGGIALVLHGVVRMTADLDIIIDLEQENIDRFLSAMHDLGYKPKIPVPPEEFKDPMKRREWKDEKNMVVFSFFNPQKPFQVIDVFIENPIPFNEIDKEKTIITAGDISIPIVSINLLKKLKKISGRAQDMADISALNDLEELNSND